VAQPDGTWLPAHLEISKLQGILESIAVVPQTGPSVQGLESELSETQDQLTVVSAAIVQAVAEYDAVQARSLHLRERVSALEEDLQRHKDAALLARLGSRHSNMLGDDPHCPTCNQFLPDGFDITSSPMSPEDNIRFIEQELSVFRNMLSDAERRRDVEATKVHRWRDQANAVRSQIRSLKDTLTSPSAMPSIAAIAQHIRVEEQIASLRRFTDQLQAVLTELVDRARSWRLVDEELKALGNDPLSILDREKIGFVDESFRDQLRAYRFRSMSPDNITISEDTYRPVHEGFDLGFDLSASDMIRAMWAYLLSFAEVGLKHATNHLGLLVLDEPRQQEVHRNDFAAFLLRLARDGSDGLQVIVATSEEHGGLIEMLGDTPHTLISLDPGTKVLRQL
jgi:regulator of replication initiation timing